MLFLFLFKQNRFLTQTFKHTTILLILIAVATGCRQTKYVPSGEYLLKKNNIEQSGDKIPEGDLTEIFRQQPNFQQIGVKWKLLAFNMVDSAKVSNKRYRKNLKLTRKNTKRRAKQKEINEARVKEAQEKGSEYYTEKIIPLKDTVSPRKFFREWFKYKIGQPPVVFDSIPFNKTLEQLTAYLRGKGYYHGRVTAFVRYTELKREKGKAIVTYSVESGDRYYIDSFYVISNNSRVKASYAKYLADLNEPAFIGQPFDAGILDDHREDAAKYMRDHTFYGFSGSHINYIADTNRQTMKVILGVEFLDRYIRPSYNPDTLIAVKHNLTGVRSVYFHIADTTLYKGNFEKTMDSLQISVRDGQFIRTTESFDYAEIIDKKKDELDKKRMATFQYNGELFLRPELLEMQNYLEEGNTYKEYYVERSYTRLLQLGLFKTIKVVVEEVEGKDSVDAHYYLVPAKKQTFGIEPKATNKNGFLGVSASLNYTNRNLYGRGHKLVISLSGGFESQPVIFEATVDGTPIESAGKNFNTFEFGPSIKYEVPGLFPAPVTMLSKRHRAKAIISAAYNFQQRSAFKRRTFQLNYGWEFFVAKTQIFQAGLPFVSVIKYVNIRKSDQFEETLNNLNDLFLLNAYSDQFVWQDWKFTFEYNIKDKKERHGRTQVYFNSTFDPAGNLLSLFKKSQDTLANGQRTIFGVGYSQFTRIDNELIVSQPFGKERSLNFHFNIGGGIPYGNSTNSLPYDYSFFAGGANDNRGWKARALGPGSYKYYLDTNRTATQIGDMRLGGSVEYRFSLSPTFKGALFVDAGNIWTVGNDVNRPGGQISGNFLNEIAVAAGIGLRVDLDFFIVRVDLGLPLRNPALPKSARWVFQDRKAYHEEGEAFFGSNYAETLPKAFSPQLHFGIGYPF
ncbi:MAG: outer membrane protein insertion porin family [Crocinitomicaceae bacterium]|jgi:outer membrane protein insertion porin family